MRMKVIVLVLIVVLSGIVLALPLIKSLIDQHTFTCPSNAQYCYLLHNGSLRPGKSATYKMYAIFKNITTTSTTSTTSTVLTTVPTTTTTFTCGDGNSGTVICCAREIPCNPPTEGVICIEEVPC